MIRRLAPWAALVVVLGIALFVGGRDEGGPRTVDQRVQRIAAEVRCPTCESLSAAESDAPASEAIRDAIRERIEAGDSDGEIRAFLVSRFGRDILLRPDARGVAGLIWVLPVAGIIVAAGALALTFRRWSRRPAAVATPEDEALVARALRSP